jgi:GNAT superfamily N-acetyltransferase
MRAASGKNRLLLRSWPIMSAVVHRKRLLLARPRSMEILGVAVRNYAGPHDIPGWLRLRDLAFARQKVGIRQWDEGDFRREFLDKPWWRPEWMWLAFTGDGQPSQAIGSVTLAIRQSASAAVPVVHWLCVSPRWRRHGVGRLLMSILEQAAWDAGYREVALETHEAWREAASLYDALGYEVRRETAT